MGLTGEHGEEAVGADVYLGIGRAVEIEVKTYRDGSADVVVTEKQNRTCPRDVLKAVRRSTGCVAVRVHVPETVGPARRERLHRSRRSRRGSCHQIPYAGGRGFVAQVLSFPIAARIRRFAAIRLVQLWVVESRIRGSACRWWFLCRAGSYDDQQETDGCGYGEEGNRTAPL